MKSQISLEFSIILAAVILLSVTLISVAFIKVSAIKTQDNFQKMHILKDNIENEIQLARNSHYGYIRRFYLPSTIDSKNYNITTYDDFIVISYEGITGEFPVGKINGTIQKGLNKITNKNGEIIIN
jgi:hypothetical protein